MVHAQRAKGIVQVDWQDFVQNFCDLGSKGLKLEMVGTVITTSADLNRSR